MSWVAMSPVININSKQNSMENIKMKAIISSHNYSTQAQRYIPVSFKCKWITIKNGNLPSNYVSWYYKLFHVNTPGLYYLFGIFDDYGTIYVNGKLIASNLRLGSVSKIPINLQKGYYIIEVKLRNTGGPTAFALAITDSTKNLDKILCSDTSWTASTSRLNWQDFIPKPTISNTTSQGTPSPYNPYEYSNYQKTNTTFYTKPVEMGMSGSSIENILSKYGIYIAVGLLLVLLLRRE